MNDNRASAFGPSLLAGMFGTAFNLSDASIALLVVITFVTTSAFYIVIIVIAPRPRINLYQQPEDAVEGERRSNYFATSLTTKLSERDV